MKAFTTSIIGVLFLIACGTEESTTPDNTSGNDSSAVETPIAPAEKPGVMKPVSDISYWKKGEGTVDLSNLTFAGEVQYGTSWKDSKGTNVLLLTQEEETETTDKNGEPVRSRKLYGYHYLTQGTAPMLLWEINDFVKECPFDVILNFIEGSLEVTDLDGNGIGESIFMYRADCVSDVSPQALKLIMHEGDKKYAVRGSSQVDLGGDLEMMGGKNTPDDAFSDAHETFLMYALAKWEQHKKQ